MYRTKILRSIALVTTIAIVAATAAVPRSSAEEPERGSAKSRLPEALVRSGSKLMTTLVAGDESGALRLGFDTRSGTIRIRRTVRGTTTTGATYDTSRDQELTASFDVTSVAAGLDEPPVIESLYVAGTDPQGNATRIERWRFTAPEPPSDALPTVSRELLFAGPNLTFVRKVEVDPEQRFLLILTFDGSLWRLDLSPRDANDGAETPPRKPVLLHDPTSIPLIGHAIDMELLHDDRVGRMLVLHLPRRHDAKITVLDPDDDGRFGTTRTYNEDQWYRQGHWKRAGHASPIAGIWRAWIESPGGDLPFQLVIDDSNDELRAQIGNGAEWIDVPSVTLDGATLVFDMPHYDSRFNLTPGKDGVWNGRWKKRRGVDTWADMFVHATRNDARRFLDFDPATHPSPSAFAGRWTVDFESSDDPAVAVFELGPDPDIVYGTILTTTGDYRYLAGNARGNEDGSTLRLSCFDGAHAFLFHLRTRDRDTLTGDFWSSANWHETFTATREPEAELPDAFEQTSWNHELALEDVSFPDLDGTPRSLADPAFAGKARILQIFGSWCPNCHDASDFMAKLHREYGPQGLSVVGLAFELTGEHERDAEQARRYAKRHGVSYPILVAGVADKAKATESLGLLDRVRSFPTTVFLHGDGRVRAIHTGFTGPATGEAYDELRADFRAIIEELLADSE